MFSSRKLIRIAWYPVSRMQIVAIPRFASFSSDACSSGENKVNSPNTGSIDGKKPDQPSACCSSPSDCKPSTPTFYDCRKYGHCLPTNDICPPFDPLPSIPTGVFRCTEGERLGAGAIKCGCYQCPEYFAYQHMTFYDMHLILRSCRGPSPKTERKP